MTPDEILTPANINSVNHHAYRMSVITGRRGDIEDFRQEGYVGLLQASARHDESKGANLHTFSARRIWGRMVDAMRETDQFSRYRPEKNPVQLIDIESKSIPESLLVSGDNPERSYQEAETRRHVRAAIDALPKNLRDVLVMYYFDELTMENIAGAIGVSPSRVHQMLRKASDAFRVKYLAAQNPLRVSNKAGEGKILRAQEPEEDSGYRLDINAIRRGLMMAGCP